MRGYKMKHELPKLNYKYNALEPFIDERTMEIHHTKHHQTYIDKLNATLEGYHDLETKKIEDLLKEIGHVPESIKQAVINHGGGHANHSLFWDILSNPSKKPTDKMNKIIVKHFGSFEKFKKEFSDAATAQFGSGWAWLVVDEVDGLSIIKTPNQNSPLMDGKIPILGLDVWEHAYYLRYQNKRADYIEAFFNVINWEKVEENYDKALKKD